MKNFLFLILSISVIGLIFYLPLTINSFTNESLYKEDTQKIINNKYTNDDNADFLEISSTDKVKCVIISSKSYSIKSSIKEKVDLESIDFKNEEELTSFLNGLSKKYVLVNPTSLLSLEKGTLIKKEIQTKKVPIIICFGEEKKEEEFGLALNKFLLKNPDFCYDNAKAVPFKQFEKIEKFIK